MGFFDFLNRKHSVNEIKGSIGEWMAKVYSKMLPGALVLHDVLIDGADGFTSQIDLVLVGNKGLYVVEIKMFDDAKIYGDTKRTNWNYYKHGKKYEIYSPLKQNQKHVEYLQDFLKEFGDIPCFSVITMLCEDFKISGENGKNTAICNSLPAMEQAIYKIADGKPEIFDDNKKQEIFDYIKNNQHIGKEKREIHKQKVMEYKDKLKEEQSRCPFCNGELVLRKGKNGEFYGCKNFPKCRVTKNVK